MASITNLSSGIQYNTGRSAALEGQPDASVYFADPDQAAAAEFQQLTTQFQNEWSAAQVQKQMEFQERLANTAHQREVVDLKAAGLNPILSSGGKGAAVTSGAAAQAQSPGANIASMVNNMLATQASMENARVSAAASLAIAGIQAETARQTLSWEKEKAEKYPSNLVQLLNVLLGNDQNGSSGVQNGRSFLNNAMYQLISSGTNQSGWSLSQFLRNQGFGFQNAPGWIQRLLSNGRGPSGHSSGRF